MATLQLNKSYNPTLQSALALFNKTNRKKLPTQVTLDKHTQTITVTAIDTSSVSGVKATV